MCPNDRMATLVLNPSAKAPKPPEPGAVIGGRYEIEKLIGRGGYGQVYQARHQGTGQPIALKVLLPQLGADTFAIKRFFLEARVTSGLKHPNTVRVFDFGQEDSGLVFLAMELLTGRTLRAAFRERKEEEIPFSEREAAEIGIAMTRSLGEAHEAGLVHRDLKPDNVFLHQVPGDDPVVKVLDFGIVKLDDSPHTLSSTTSVPGTPAYMSPEHALNQSLDGRADLYSIGVILYELVTMELPFVADSDPQKLYLHAFGQLPDLRRKAKAPLSDQMVWTISRLLAKSPGSRFDDTRALRHALTDVVEGRVAPEAKRALARSRWRKHTRSGRLAAAISALALAGVGAAALLGSSDRPIQAEPLAAPKPPAQANAQKPAQPKPATPAKPAEPAAEPKTDAPETAGSNSEEKASAPADDVRRKRSARSKRGKRTRPSRSKRSRTRRRPTKQPRSPKVEAKQPPKPPPKQDNTLLHTPLEELLEKSPTP